VEAVLNGRHLFELSQHLGHSSTNVTSGIYGHFERAERKKETEKMEGVFGV
jgi:integrase